MNRLLPILLLNIATFAFAQNAEKEQLRVSGTFRGAVRGGLQIATDGNELWNVRLPGKPDDISFTANAEVSFLRPGMYVQLSGVVNKKGQLAEPVSSLLIYTPQNRTDMGVYPENAGGEAANPLAGLFMPDEPESNEQPAKGKGVKRVVEDQPYRIGGVLSSLKGERFTVSAGGVQIKGELSEKVKVRVSTSNLAFAQLGDKVEMEGWYYAGARQQGAWANRLSVTAVNTLEGEKKQSRTSDNEEKKKDTEVK